MELLNCEGCKNQITEDEVGKNQVVMVLNRLWHREHIQCIYCKLQISDNRYFRSSSHNFQPACFNCHVQTTHPACVVCSLPIIERGLVAFDRLFHFDCFRCSHCNKTIPQRRGFYERDMMLYDEICYMMHVRDPPPVLKET